MFPCGSPPGCHALIMHVEQGRERRPTKHQSVVRQSVSQSRSPLKLSKWFLCCSLAVRRPGPLRASILRPERTNHREIPVNTFTSLGEGDGRANNNRAPKVSSRYQLDSFIGSATPSNGLPGGACPHLCAPTTRARRVKRAQQGPQRRGGGDAHHSPSLGQTTVSSKPITCTSATKHAPMTRLPRLAWLGYDMPGPCLAPRRWRRS
jgi:hypothetical protein